MKSNHEIIFANSSKMEKLSDQSIDLTITSCPYPMIEMWDTQFSDLNPQIQIELEEGNGNIAFELMHQELDKTWKETFRVLKEGGIICINIGDATRKIGNNFQLFPNHSRIIKYFSELGCLNLPPIIWRKPTNAPNKFLGSGMLPTNAYVTLEHEHILIFRKGTNRKIENSRKKQRYASAYFWEERNNWFSDIWFDLLGIPQDINNIQTRARSAAFPFELAYRLINMFSIQADYVLDPFLGTGTTMLAAMASGRNSIGYELDGNFLEIIENRLEGIIKFSNDYLQNRIKKHEEFVHQRELENKPLKYCADNYNFKVMTAQETNISIPFLKAINKITDYKYEIFYSSEID